MDIGALFKNSWEKFSTNIGIGIVIYLVGAIVASIAGAFTLGIAAMPILAGIIKAMRTIQQGGTPEFGDVFSEFNNFGKWFQLWLVFLAIFVCAGIIGVIPVLGQMIAPVLGLLIGFFLFFTMPLMLDKNMTAFDAAKASFEYVKSNVGNLIGAVLLTLIVQGIFAIITGPWMSVQMWMIYDESIGRSAEAV